MDVGVGVFCVINGYTAPELRLTALGVRQRLRSIAPIALLGVGRLLAVKALGYHEHVSEYGVHGNFFFTLAAIKLFVALVNSRVCLQRWPTACVWLAAVVLVAYQSWLTLAGGEHLVLHGLDGLDQRQSLFDADREWLASLFGFAALYLLGMQWGAWTQSAQWSILDWLFYLLKLIVALAMCHMGAVALHEGVGILPSRRMANATYVFFTVTIPCSTIPLADGDHAVHRRRHAGRRAGVDDRRRRARAALLRHRLSLRSAQPVSHDRSQQVRTCVLPADQFEHGYSNSCTFSLSNAGLINFTIPTIDTTDPYLVMPILVGHMLLPAIIVSLMAHRRSPTKKYS